jgi:hypothetical protein
MFIVVYVIHQKKKKFGEHGKRLCCIFIEAREAVYKIKPPIADDARQRTTRLL